MGCVLPPPPQAARPPNRGTIFPNNSNAINFADLAICLLSLPYVLLFFCLKKIQAGAHELTTRMNCTLPPPPQAARPPNRGTIFPNNSRAIFGHANTAPTNIQALCSLKSWYNKLREKQKFLTFNFTPQSLRTAPLQRSSFYSLLFSRSACPSRCLLYYRFLSVYNVYAGLCYLFNFSAL